MYGILTENLKKLAQSCPFPLYVVGGRVRDYIAGFTPEETDTDLCAPAAAEEFLKFAKENGFTATAVYKNTGTVKIKTGGEEYEFTSFRSDEYIRGEHVPANIYFTGDIYLDARRRDFKCNAVYYDIKAQKIVDPLGGAEDIKNRILDTVAPPAKVFGEDGLRLMRLARIAAQTGFEPTGECIEAARFHCGLIKDVSAERILGELNLILRADKRYGIKYAQYRGLVILKETGVLKIILPELAAGEGMEQNKEYHNHDVLEHSLRCAMYADPSIRLAALLHDVGKPYCYERFKKFTGHEEAGAEIALKICKRLKVPKKQTEETVRLTALHMYDLKCDARENKVRKFIVRNADILDKLLLLKQADYSACKDDTRTAPSVVKIEGIREKMRQENLPFGLKELKIKGDELIGLGFPPAKVGELLEDLLMDCVINIVPNDNACLKAYARKKFRRLLIT